MSALQIDCDELQPAYRRADGLCLYRARVWHGYGGISDDEYKIIKKTPCGWWIDVDGQKKWTSGKFASATKEEALDRLRHRTRSYLRRAVADVVDALERMRDLEWSPPAETVGRVKILAADLGALYRKNFGRPWTMPA